MDEKNVLSIRISWTMRKKGINPSVPSSKLNTWLLKAAHIYLSYILLFQNLLSAKFLKSWFRNMTCIWFSKSFCNNKLLFVSNLFKRIKWLFEELKCIQDLTHWVFSETKASANQPCLNHFSRQVKNSCRCWQPMQMVTSPLWFSALWQRNRY